MKVSGLGTVHPVPGSVSLRRSPAGEWQEEVAHTVVAGVVQRDLVVMHHLHGAALIDAQDQPVHSLSGGQPDEDPLTRVPLPSGSSTSAGMRRRRWVYRRHGRRSFRVDAAGTLRYAVTLVPIAVRQLLLGDAIRSGLVNLLGRPARRNKEAKADEQARRPYAAGRTDRRAGVTMISVSPPARCTAVTGAGANQARRRPSVGYSALKRNIIELDDKEVEPQLLTPSRVGIDPQHSTRNTIFGGR